VRPKASWTARSLWIAGALIGLAVVVWLVRSVGLADIAAAARHLGIGGFLLVCLASIGLFLALGAAWQAGSGEPARRIPLFAFARLVREAAADFLPLAQIGGLAAGARIVRMGGVSSPRIYASMIVDQVTEMASQIVFSLAGVAAATAFLAAEPAQAPLRRSIIGGSIGLALMLLAFLFGQRRFLRLASGLAHRILPGVSALLIDTEAELVRLYARRSHVAISFAWNLVAWLAMAAVGWLILALIGHPLGLGRLVAIEAAIAAVRSAAFLIPGALGLQEAAYVAIGPLFGLPVEAAITLSLVKRARDGALALTGLLAWQGFETWGAAKGWRSRSGQRQAGP